MNREIKFRAWSEVGRVHGGKTGVMVYFDPKDIKHDFDCSVKDASHWVQYQVWATFSIPSYDEHGVYQEDPDIDFENLQWMQFTGLKDKNGKEIYEGDVVKIKKRVWCGETEKERWTSQIVWIKCLNLGYCKAYFDSEAKDIWNNGQTYEDYSDDWEENENIEVIGNIYETPELLK